MFVAISDMLSYFSLSGIEFGIQSSHVNCKYSMSVIFVPYSGSRIFIFLFPKVISYPRIITIHSLYISLSIGLP